jgi:hypothetical protein
MLRAKARRKEGIPVEGYWLTHYKFGMASGLGIAMLHQGELMGGDCEHIWSGVYEEDGSTINVIIRVVPAVSSQEVEALARDQPVILLLSGYCTEEFARLEGYPEHRKDQRCEVEMRKCTGSSSLRQIEKKAA